MTTNEKFEINVGDKVILLGDLTNAGLEEVMKTFMMDFEFNKDAVVKKIVALCQLNKDVLLEEEDYYYISNEIDSIFGSYLLDVEELVDDNVIEYKVKREDGSETILIVQKPDFKAIKELDAYMRRMDDAEMPKDIYAFVKGLIITNIVEKIPSVDGTIVYSDITAMADAKIAVALSVHYSAHIKRKRVTVKKKY